MKVNALTVVLGLGFLITGLFAFFAPTQFFSLLGSYYGTFNSHFVKDAGIAFFCSGFLLLLSLKIIQWRLPLTFCGSLFVILHGAFHTQMIMRGMVPTAFDIGIELVVIIMPSVLTAALLILRILESRKHAKASLTN